MRETTPDLTRISKYISLILRHKPEVIGISWMPRRADVNALLAASVRSISLTGIFWRSFVRSDSKQRYIFNEDRTRIRASQGHSVQVDVELPVAEPPETLYHGTARPGFPPPSRPQGLLPQSRLYVHLSPDVETAEKVGRRHGEPVVYLVDAGQMHRDRLLFYPGPPMEYG